MDTLWWTNIAMEKSTMLLMGKSTISMAIFNSFLYVHQRVKGHSMGHLMDIWDILDCIKWAVAGRRIQGIQRMGGSKELIRIADADVKHDIISGWYVEIIWNNMGYINIYMGIIWNNICLVVY